MEKLIPSDHLARAISELAGRLGMAEFLKENKSVVGHAGRPRTCPQMLLAIWVYSYSQGMGAGRRDRRRDEVGAGVAVVGWERDVIGPNVE